MSATNGVRERRKQTTRLQLTLNSRRLTAEHGFNGFTIEELCEAVGVSRRTFFNYFPAKEDAVIGHRDDHIYDEAIEQFMAVRPADMVGVSPRLLDDLIQFTVAHADLAGASPSEVKSFIAAIGREPQLLSRFMRDGAEKHQFLTELVARREGVEATHPLVVTAVTLMVGLSRQVSEQYFTPGNTVPFETLILSAVEATRTLCGVPPSA